MDCLATSDVEEIVNLVSRAGDPTVDVPLRARKRELVEGLAALVDADIFYWPTLVLNPQVSGDYMGTSFIDGGWKSDEERLSFYSTFADPAMYPATMRLDQYVAGRHITMNNYDQLPLESDRRIWRDALEKNGIGQYLVSVYPLDSGCISFLIFYRRIGRPPFTDRDLTVVHVVTSQVHWLHIEGLNVPAKDKVHSLSRREREVMFLLLGGDSQKQVANKIKLSEHTVGDYIKQIYKRFEVSSRAELLAHFISGGQLR